MSASWYWTSPLPKPYILSFPHCSFGAVSQSAQTILPIWPFSKYDPTLGGISWPFGPALLGRLIPSSEEGFCWYAAQCAITGLGLNSQRSLDTCLLVMVQESIPSHCIFSYLELHYYNHWSFIELYIWSTASSLVIIFVGGSVILLII